MNKYETLSIEDIRAEVERITKRNKQRDSVAIDTLIVYVVMMLVGGLAYYAYC